MAIVLVLSVSSAINPGLLPALRYWTSANLNEADVSTKPADWTGRPDTQDVEIARVKGADLRGTDLRYASAFRAFFVKARLEGANLSGADLREANLRDANLRGADLAGVRFCRTTMPDGTKNNTGC